MEGSEEEEREGSEWGGEERGSKERGTGWDVKRDSGLKREKGGGW